MSNRPEDNFGLQLMAGAGMLWAAKRMIFGKGKDQGTEAELEKLRLLQKIGEQSLEAQRLAMRKEVAIKSVEQGVSQTPRNSSQQGTYRNEGGSYVKK